MISRAQLAEAIHAASAYPHDTMRSEHWAMADAVLALVGPVTAEHKLHLERIQRQAQDDRELALADVQTERNEARKWAIKCAESDATVLRLRTALRSIASNTCCGSCREAACVARAALEAM